MSNKLCKGCGKPLDFNEKVCSNCGFDSILGKYKEIQKVRKISEETMKKLEFLFVCIIIIISSLLIIIIGIKKRIPVEPNRKVYVEESVCFDKKLAKEVFDKESFDKNNKIVTKSKVVKTDSDEFMYLCWETRKYKNQEYKTKIYVAIMEFKKHYGEKNEESLENAINIRFYGDIRINATLYTKKEKEKEKRRIVRISNINNTYYIDNFRILCELEKDDEKNDNGFYFTKTYNEYLINDKYKNSKVKFFSDPLWHCYKENGSLNTSWYYKEKENLEEDYRSIIKKYEMKIGDYNKIKKAYNYDALGNFDIDYLNANILMTYIDYDGYENLEKGNQIRKNGLKYHYKFKVHYASGKEFEETDISDTIRLKYDNINNKDE